MRTPRALIKRHSLCLLAALTLLIALCVAVLPALAHAELLSSEPAAGATVPYGQAEIRLTFNAPLAPASQIVVFAEQFQPVAGVTSSVEAAVLLATLATPLGEGTYTVQWTAGAVDGHLVEGSYQFAVSPPPVGAGAGPALVFGSSLIIGGLSLAAIVLLSRHRRRP